MTAPQSTGAPKGEVTRSAHEGAAQYDDCTAQSKSKAASGTAQISGNAVSHTKQPAQPSSFIDSATSTETKKRSAISAGLDDVALEIKKSKSEKVSQALKTDSKAANLKKSSTAPRKKPSPAALAEPSSKLGNHLAKGEPTLYFVEIDTKAFAAVTPVPAINKRGEPQLEKIRGKHVRVIKRTPNAVKDHGPCRSHSDPWVQLVASKLPGKDVLIFAEYKVHECMTNGASDYFLPINQVPDDLSQQYEDMIAEVRIKKQWHNIVKPSDLALLPIKLGKK